MGAAWHVPAWQVLCTDVSKQFKSRGSHNRQEASSDLPAHGSYGAGVEAGAGVVMGAAWHVPAWQVLCTDVSKQLKSSRSHNRQEASSDLPAHGSYGVLGAALHVAPWQVLWTAVSKQLKSSGSHNRQEASS